MEFSKAISHAALVPYVIEQTGLRERIVIESKERNRVPVAHILDENGQVVRTYNFPINGHIAVEDGQQLAAGDILVKIPRAITLFRC